MMDHGSGSGGGRRLLHQRRYNTDGRLMGWARAVLCFALHLSIRTGALGPSGTEGGFLLSSTLWFCFRLALALALLVCVCYISRGDDEVLPNNNWVHMVVSVACVNGDVYQGCIR